MNQPYKLSFTAGSLLHKESVSLAENLLETKSWVAAREKALTDNLLQSRTVSTATRTIREVGHRLKTLSTPELELLVQGSPDEQSHILWLAICRCYQLIAEFVTEVVREKFLSMSYTLEEEDFDFFLNKKAEWHDELETIQQATRDKLKQVVFRMLREVGILSKENDIIPALLSPQVQDLITDYDRNEFLFFPVMISPIN